MLLALGFALSASAARESLEGRVGLQTRSEISYFFFFFFFPLQTLCYLQDLASLSSSSRLDVDLEMFASVKMSASGVGSCKGEL